MRVARLVSVPHIILSACIWHTLMVRAQGSPGPASLKPIRYNSSVAPSVTQIESVSDMRADIFKFWLQHGPDKQYGGFHGTLDRRGNAISPTNKTLVAQARHLWSLSALLLSSRQQEVAAEARAAADNLFNFMKTHMLIQVPLHSTGGQGRAFVHMVRQDGSRDTPSINMYANAFAIYGLSKYAQATGFSEAVTLALRVLRTLDTLYHNPKTGGYDESNTIGGVVFDSVPLNTVVASSSVKQQQQQRLSQSLNTLFHAAEALTELSRATKGHEPLVQARLLELVKLLTGKLVLQPDTQTAFLAVNYDPNTWTPVSTDYISYGHNIEVTWLLPDSIDQLKASGTIDGRAAAEMISVLQKIGSTAVRLGWDVQYGGFYDGGAATHSTPGNKVFWVQAESMLGLNWLYRQTGQQHYKDKLQSVLRFVRQNLWDRQYGEWYWVVPRAGGQPLTYTAGGLSYDARVKGNGWKASYHVGRALLFLESMGY